MSLFKSTLILFFVFQFFSSVSPAQEKFDIVTFTAPKNWQKEIKPNAVQFTTQNEADGTFAVMLLLKAIPAGDNSKKNFNLSWESIVKERFEKVNSPAMASTASENGWTIESGMSPYEQDGTKGAAMLVSASGGGKVVNLLILTNSQNYQSQITVFIGSIILPKIEAAKINPSQTIQASSIPQKSNFKFGTTNFDNGWTAVEENDWVRVTKGAITVLLHYPHPKEKETFYELEKEARAFWDLLVAPRYGNLSNFEVLRSDRAFEPARFAAGNVTDNKSGEKVFVALFSKQKRGWIEVIAPDKTAFAREFGSINIDDEIINWKPLLALFDYNKFAVDAADLQGKWITNFAGTTAYASIYTGRYIGAITIVSATSYDFGAGNSYNYRTDGASSSGGRTDFSKAESSGNFSLPTNWEIRFSDIEGRPQTFPVHFSCIRGARVLWIRGFAFGRVD